MTKKGQSGVDKKNALAAQQNSLIDSVLFRAILRASRLIHFFGVVISVAFKALVFGRGEKNG